MRALPEGLQAHLDSGATTLCYCWRVTRADGLVQGFTDHDEDLVFDGTRFAAETGFTATQVQQTLGLAVDNLNVDGALSSETLNEDDLACGRYDDAFVELFRVNWRDVAQRYVQHAGYTGEARRQGSAFSAELRGLSSRLGQTTIRTFQRTCDAQLGDGRCKVDVEQPTFTGTGTVVGNALNRALRVEGLGAYAAGWFRQGNLTFLDGRNEGVRVDVKDHTGGAEATGIELWASAPFPVEIGAAVKVRAGCLLTREMCREKFVNIANFQGFPTMPGNDFVLRNVDPSASNTGSSTTTVSNGKG